MSKSPNLVFIIADDHGTWALNCYGNPQVATPALDRLAARGMKWDNMYILGGDHQAVCIPSRANLHTGNCSFQSTANHNNPWEIKQEYPLLFEHLRNHGYTTFGTGKWHNCPMSYNRSFGQGGSIFFGGMKDHFDAPLHEYDPSGQYPRERVRSSKEFATTCFTDEAIRFIDSHDGNQPFAAYVAFTAPHDPRKAPTKYHQRFRREEMELPGNYMPSHPFDNGELAVRDECLANTPRTREDIQQHLSDYYAMVAALNDDVARLEQTLRDKGQLDNTLFIYTSDHGLSVGRHGLMGKQNLYDHSVKVPFIMAGPNVPEGVTSSVLCTPLSIFPTVCRLLDIVPPASVSEKPDLLALATTEKGEQIVGAAYRDVQRMVCNGRYKLIKYRRSSERNEGSQTAQLFDLKKDPLELENLYGKETIREVQMYLLHALNQWMTEQQDFLSIEDFGDRRSLPVSAL